MDTYDMMTASEVGSPGTRPTGSKRWVLGFLAHTLAVGIHLHVTVALTKEPRRKKPSKL